MLIEMAVLSSMVICYFLLVKKIKQEKKTENESLPILQFADYLEPKYFGERIYITCYDSNCNLRYECANHHTAGDMRGDTGMSPCIVNEKNFVFCHKVKSDLESEAVLESDDGINFKIAHLRI